MTKIGSPLWAAPEVLKGMRYTEDVDVYALGVVMIEIAIKSLPYLAQFKKTGGSRDKLMRAIALGEIKPQMGRKTKVGTRYRKLFKRATSYEPRERPEMSCLVGELESILYNEKRKSEGTKAREDRDLFFGSHEALLLTEEFTQGSLKAASECLGVGFLVPLLPSPLLSFPRISHSNIALVR